MPPQKPQGRPSGQKPDGRAPESPRDEIRYPIPPASARAFARRDWDKPQNPGLIFDRFAPDWVGKATIKKDGLEEVRKAAEKVDGALLKGWNNRWGRLVRAANAKPFSLKTDWRFIAGLGRKGPLEVGFTFHRYGFPILPGSSVKGVARAWALIQIAESVGESDLKALDALLSADGEKESRERMKYEDWREALPEDTRKLAEDFRTIFGTTAVAGRAVFFDAIPAGKPTLELDIMNPHYPKYYSGDEFPTDWQSPVPVYFLTVAAGTEFHFAVGWGGTLEQDGERLRSLAEQWLRAGLRELGAGAKTMAGYGYFAIPAPKGGPVAPEKPQAVAPQSEPLVTPEPLVWRTGTVREYRPDKGVGRLVDAETREELRFKREAIEEKGWSPGRKVTVMYIVEERAGRRVVVRVRKR